MVEKIITISTLAAAIVLGIMLQSTSPSSTGPVGILAVFFCIYIILLGGISWLLYAASWVVRKLPHKKATRSRLSMRRAYYYASVVAVGPVILLAVGSVGRFGVYEVLLTTLLVLIGVFYIKKRAS